MTLCQVVECVLEHDRQRQSCAAHRSLYGPTKHAFVSPPHLPFAISSSHACPCLHHVSIISYVDRLSIWLAVQVNFIVIVAFFFS